MPDADQLKAYLANRDVACPGCGYNLRGSPEPWCAECGSPFDVLSLTRSPAPPAGRFVIYAVHALGLLFGFVIIAFVLSALPLALVAGLAVWLILLPIAGILVLRHSIRGAPRFGLDFWLPNLFLCALHMLPVLWIVVLVVLWM